MDALKQELTRIGCKCGGSLKERAQRLLSTKGCSKRSELDTKMLANAPTNDKIKSKNITRQAVDSIAKEIAVLEAQVRRRRRRGSCSSGGGGGGDFMALTFASARGAWRTFVRYDRADEDASAEEAVEDAGRVGGGDGE